MPSPTFPAPPVPNAAAAPPASSHVGAAAGCIEVSTLLANQVLVEQYEHKGEE
jgi:hypothetical protein